MSDLTPEQERAAQELTEEAMRHARRRSEVEQEVGPLEEIAPGIYATSQRISPFVDLRNALAKGERDARLLDARDFDPQPWRAAEKSLVDGLTEFAIWFSNTWEDDNSDDREAAEQWVHQFLEGGER